MSLLAERLGFPDGERILIVDCDDLGLCLGANIGVYESLHDGIATSASLMIPPAWARSAAFDYGGEDIGIQLTLNAEHDRYRWGPITQAPSLLDGDGGFPRTVEDMWEHADADEVRRECRAQIERALHWGVEVTHLDSHLGALERRPEFFDIYLDLADELRLPIQLPEAPTERRVGFPFRALAEERGVVFPDHVIGSRRGTSTIEELIAEIEPGVTALSLRPAIETAELSVITPDAPSRVADHRLLTHAGAGRRALAAAGVRLLGYRELRDVMRTR
jgi:predicted glycoside hydrolase/deacetylase ChbG (UPF0249 family)